MTRHKYFSIHNHSRYSVTDAIPRVEEMVTEAARLGYPALGLTDHGVVSGNLELYKACIKQGVAPLPGVELYVTANRSDKEQKRGLHLTVVAINETGYRNLCKLITRTAVNFYYAPRVDLADLAEMYEAGLTRGLVIGTGCWFGLLPTVMRRSGPEAATYLAKTLARWFPDGAYVELQNHGIETQREDTAWIVGGETYNEDDMVAELVTVANEAGLPYIITSDAHYAVARDQKLHDGLKELCVFTDNPDDGPFPGGPYCLMDAAALSSYFEPDVLDRACANLSDLADRAKVRIPELDTYKMLLPDVTIGGDPQAELEYRTTMSLIKRMPAETSKAKKDRYSQRLDSELAVVRHTGYAGVLLLFAEVCDFMRTEKIVFNARGSANNFLINWLLDITNVDSVAWDLRPERFLSVDRTSPPDADLDIEDARRDEVVTWASRKWSTAQIGTLGTYSLWADTEDESGKGSLPRRYYTVMGKRGRKMDGWRDVPQAHKDVLRALSDRKLISGYGTHAAGLVIAPDSSAIARLPMVMIGPAGKKHLVSAYDKNAVEDLGFIKADFLGSITLTACSIATDLVMETLGITGRTPIEFLVDIPLNEERVFKRLSLGRTKGCYQVQGDFTTDVVKRLKPRNMRDLVALMALGRPAVRDIRNEYFGRRKKQLPMPAMHPDLWAETKKTYGLLIYQEQVIGALRALGMDVPELNKLLKAVKASNEYVVGARVAIADALPRITALAERAGWSESDIAMLIDAVEGYGDYGFNEGHAVSYGLMAYWTSWLAEFHPNEFWTGVLTAYSGTDDETAYCNNARREGIRLIKPHVNYSDVSYTFDRDRGAIRRGLLSIKDVGPVASEELAQQAPFLSLRDLGEKCNHSKVTGAKNLALGKPLDEAIGNVRALALTGALDGLEP